MKNAIPVLMFSLLSIVSFGQKMAEKNVPKAVKTALSKKFPKVKSEKWEKEKGNYEANFEIAEVETSVLISPKGDIIETETEIAVDQLPANISVYVAKHYPGQKITEASRIVDSKGKVTLEAEVKGVDLIFDNQGAFIRSAKD